MTEIRGRSGILLVDKAGGMTSHDVVSRVRRLAETRRVGHAGTLDPMATGLLVLGVGGSTRLLTYLVGLDKEYVATIRLGASTPSDDADSPVDRIADPDRLAALTEQQIREAIRPLTGAIRQVPSTVSAIKVNGQRAYARARAGETVELGSRAVTVSAFDVLGIRFGEYVDVEVRVECSTGTYIRALARDLGRALHVGGHLTALRRTRVGPFGIERAHPLESLDVESQRLSPADVASELFAVLSLDDSAATDLGHGKRLRLPLASGAGVEAVAEGAPIAAIAPDGRLVGLVTISEGIAKPLVNFPQEESA